MYRIALAAAGAAVLALTSCSSSGKPSTSAPTGSTGRPASGVVVSAGTGGVLVASDGRTLYFNTVDTVSKIKCTGECESEWPPVKGPATAGAGLTSSDLSVATRPDGTQQVTFDGHPLYMFDEDKKAGDMKGDGLNDEGGKWHVAKATAAGGGQTAAPTTTPPTLSPTMSAGGGYTY